VGKKTTSGAGEARTQATAVPSVTAAGPGPASSISCPTCAPPNPALSAQVNPTGLRQPVYAVGGLTPQFASIAVEKEFAQLSGGAHQGDQIDLGILQELLRNPDNAYLGRHLCWVFASEGFDTFHVMPRDDAEIARLIEVLSPDESDDVVHVIVGSTVSAPINSWCAAVGLPAVQADQVLAFTLAEFAAALPSDETSSSEDSSAGGDQAGRAEFEGAARRLFVRLTHRSGNRGVADEHRALNYLACRYSALYQAVWQAQRDGKNLVTVDAQHSHSADRRLVWVRLAFRQPRTDITEQYRCLVDVTEAFPFMLRGLQPVYD
jgi:PatG C-terminal